MGIDEESKTLEYCFLIFKKYFYKFFYEQMKKCKYENCKIAHLHSSVKFDSK